MLRTLLLITVLALSACASAQPAEVVYGAEQRTKDLEEGIEEGRRFLAAGDPAAALDRFREADSIDLVEEPNYRVLVHIAEAQCRIGAVDEGLATLADFVCAVAVDAGEIPCYVGEPTLGAPGEPNPDLTDVCEERMCGELFLPYSKDHLGWRLDMLEEMRRQAAAVEAICSSDQEP